MSHRFATLAALVALVGGGIGAIGGSASSAHADAPIPTSTARLTGTFLLAGTVTVAVNIYGEHRGEAVHRNWAFTPGCASGACATVTLVRDRAKGSDRLVLKRAAPGYYVGYSTFYRPVRCGAGIYRPGERVPFRITVRITQALISGGQAVASRITASYRNQVRYNLTPCVAYLGHDAASYHGHVVLPVT
ncbi:MAG: hypothetical protein QOG59_160 [Solirubrobacteraceae bacterium]|nr:hypothetical protein [Solirubrobacteraceae bacterium]